MTTQYNVEELVSNLTQEIQNGLKEKDITDPMVIGIHTGGAWVATELHKRLACRSPLGTLNISFYRDDFTRIGVHPQVMPSDLPVSVEGRDIILVDDVLFTGRTIRAALNEIFDYGRPRRVMLATLVDRGGRELPIQADFTGLTIALQENEQIKLNGPAPLELSVISV